MPGEPNAEEPAGLERMGLNAASTLSDRLQRRLLLAALRRKES
jgi:hypothetical protein